MEVSGRKATEDEEDTTREFNELCEPCKDEQVETSANGICQECKEYMCNRCFRHHLKARLCRKHVLVVNPASMPLQDTDVSVEKCKQHVNETIKYYCRKHEIVGCGDYMIQEQGGCKPEYIKDVSKNFQEKEYFKTLIKKLDTMSSTNKESEKNIRDNQRKTRLMHEKALKEIRKFRKDINMYLDKAENDAISELNHSKSENEKRLHQLVEDCEGISAKIKDLKQKLNSRVYQGSELFIYAANCKSDVRDIEHAVAQLQSDQQLKTFTFVPDEQLLKTIASERKLGCLDVPAIDNTTLTSKTRSQKPANQKNKTKQAAEKKGVSDWNSHAEFARAYSSSDFSYLKQPTAEQLALNNIIYTDSTDVDAEIKDKLEQIMEMTGCAQDKAEIALYDNLNDTDEAVNSILMGTVDEGEWIDWPPRKQKTPVDRAIRHIDNIAPWSSWVQDRPIRTDNRSERNKESRNEMFSRRRGRGRRF
ncbi:E3 ubiquitin-protein ligase TRIM71-like [Mercenaria mercenaria]|uniref:E3 ubiquitin-protein ligase TRIM71-like n=1 Tax=Mercenaria mercenaria TaxID=6596 RepID=UPI00234E3F48|nr:E3 ubiquitin-protein ligase TRIM71-like [Mercenaria mercenaria]